MAMTTATEAAIPRWAAARRDMTTTTMATGDYDNDIDGNGATGDNVDDVDGDGATGYDNNDGDVSMDDDCDGATDDDVRRNGRRRQQ